MTQAPTLPTRLSFGTALTCAVVLLAAVPGGLGAFTFVRQSLREAREGVLTELRVSAQNAANQLRRERDLLVTRARTLSLDSDLQMGMRSILFFERIEQRLGTYNTEGALSLGSWFFSSEGILIATAPRSLEALRPFPFDAALRPWLAQLPASEVARQSHRFVTANARPLLTGLGRVAGSEGSVGESNAPVPALFLFMPVRDFLGAPAGAIITFVAPETLEGILLAQVPHGDGIHVSLSSHASVEAAHAAATGADTGADTGATGTMEAPTLRQRVEGDTLVSDLALSDLTFTLRQDFSGRLASARLRNLVLVGMLSAGLLGLGLAAFLLARVFVRPLGPLREVVRAFGQGRYDVPRPRVAFQEFGEFVDTLFALAEQTKERIRERESLARRDADLKREQMSAELGALRSQMNPHFLFNALNGVQSLLDIDTDAARGMLQQLSDLFREILECSRLTTIPLTREKDIVERYLSLQKRRFGKRLEFAFTLPPEASSLWVPVLMIQTLVENAVKHGIEGSRTGGLVTVVVQAAAEGGFECTVRNTDKTEGGVPLRRARTEAPQGTGTGLGNTRRRLALLYGREDTLALDIDPHGNALARFWFSGAPLQATPLTPRSHEGNDR